MQKHLTEIAPAKNMLSEELLFFSQRFLAKSHIVGFHNCPYIIVRNPCQHLEFYKYACRPEMKDFRAAQMKIKKLEQALKKHKYGQVSIYI